MNPSTARRATLAALTLAAALVTAACSENLPDQAITPASGVASSAASPAQPSPSPGGEVRDDGAELDLEDQSGDGSAVVVEEVGLSQGEGLVVVTREGSATPLGAALVRDGGERNLTVVLEERLTSDETVRAVLYLDSNRDGGFDPTEDTVIVDDDGDPETDDAEYRLF